MDLIKSLVWKRKCCFLFVYVIVKRPIQHLVDSSLRGVSSRAQTFVHKQREWKWSQPVHSLSHSSRSFPVVLLNKWYTCINLIRIQTIEAFQIISGYSLIFLLLPKIRSILIVTNIFYLGFMYCINRAFTIIRPPSTASSPIYPCSCG